MKISGSIIKNNKQPFIIAEISGNHMGSLSRALKLIKCAKESGASAIKLQTFDLDEMTINSKRREFFVNDQYSEWNKRSLYSLYKESRTPIEWHKQIFNFCKKIGIICFSSVFDEKSLEVLKKLKTPAFKISSFEITHLPLIEKVAKTNKPTIISTGMASLEEIKDVIKIFIKAKNKNYAFLKCTSTYPADPIDSNLNVIKHFKSKLKCEIGLSDHTIGIGASVASIALGASIIEKHITLKKNDGSIDGHFSLTPNEFKGLVKECNVAWKALGHSKIKISKKEKKSMIFRRSIYVIKNVKKGEVVSIKNIKVIRPSLGLKPRFFFKILGKKFTKDFNSGIPLLNKMIK